MKFKKILTVCILFLVAQLFISQVSTRLDFFYFRYDDNENQGDYLLYQNENFLCSLIHVYGQKKFNMTYITEGVFAKETTISMSFIFSSSLSTNSTSLMLYSINF